MGELVAGETHLTAARSLGRPEALEVRCDGSQLDPVADSIADHKSHELAQ
mgnify:CR=1 FL=1